MWKSNCLLLLLVATCVLSVPTEKVDQTTVAEVIELSSPAPTSSSLVAETSVPVAVEVIEVDSSPVPRPHRRLITYDQRQTGEINVRADLENFVFLVVPSKKASGSSIADLASSFLFRTQAKNALKKQQQRQQQAAIPAVEDSRPDEQQKAVNQFGDQFIEGRTPYKVDISSTASQSKGARFGAETRSVEILPYQPYNGRSAMLNIRALPPTTFDPQPNGFIYPPQQGNMIGSYSSFAPSDMYRQTKSLAESDLAESHNHNNFLNTLTGDGDTGNVENLDYIPNVAYLDVSDAENSFDSLNESNVNGVTDPAKYYNEDGSELKLIGAGEEQCGPDRKRDSYGVCQFIENGDI